MRMPTWTITQFLHQNTKLEATPSVKTCVSNTLKESLGQRHEHPALDNWKRLEHQAQDDWLLQKILQVKRKFIFTQTMIGKIHQEVRRSCTQFQAGGARILQSNIGQYMCKSWWIYHHSSRFPAQRCDLEQNYKRLLMNFILAYKGSRRLQRFDTGCTATSENIDRSQRRTQQTNLEGLEHISMVKNYVAEWSSSRIDQDESSRVRFYFVCWSLESKSIP